MAQSADDSSFPRRFGLLRRLTLLALLLAIVGLPLNNLFGYALLAAATVIAFAGEVTARNRPWLLSILLAFIAVAGQAVLNPPSIEEGHNIFLPDGKNDALVSGLPPDVYRLLASEFDKAHPPEKRCDPAANGCWRGLGFPDRVFAFSADGILRGAEMSRRSITSISPIRSGCASVSLTTFATIGPARTTTSRASSATVVSGWDCIAGSSACRSS